MPHIQKFAYIPHMQSHFLSNIVLRPLNIFGGKCLLVFTF